MFKITAPEYVLMKKYIEEHCGIHLENDKEYLIESRLSDLLIETGCKSFQEFHFKARTDYTNRLRDRIIDAMTTNETSWFRDKNTWEYLKEVGIPLLIDTAIQTGKASVWSAAVSTGQEIYSLLMLLDKAVKNRNIVSVLDRIDMLGTDISSSALAVASSGKYDAIAMSRGLNEEFKNEYFKKINGVWEFDQRLKSKVQFKKFNLQNSFIALGPFDMILCRNVSIYFSDSFKRDLFSKIASVLKPKGILILGATESLREFSGEFEISYYKNAVINIKK